MKRKSRMTRKLIELLMLMSTITIVGACGPAALTTVSATPTMTSASACNLSKPSTLAAGEIKIRYRIEGPSDFQKEVRCILDDDRSWAHVAYDPVHFNTTIKLVDSVEARKYCGSPYPTDAENNRISCGGLGLPLVYINIHRWEIGAQWRVLIVNHEVGHTLGYTHDYGAPCSVMHDAGCPVHPGAIWPPAQASKLAQVA